MMMTSKKKEIIEYLKVVVLWKNRKEKLWELKNKLWLLKLKLWRWRLIERKEYKDLSMKARKEQIDIQTTDIRNDRLRNSRNQRRIKKQVNSISKREWQSHTDRPRNKQLKEELKDKQINRQTDIFIFLNRFLNNNFENKFTLFFSSKFQKDVV